MIRVVPAILPQDFEHLSEELARVANHVPLVQIDVANGSYAPSTTWPYHNPSQTDGQFARIARQEEGMPFWEDLDFEVDLLLTEPENHIPDWIQVGAAGFIVHTESTDHHADCVGLIREADGLLGWGIKPSTDLEELFDLIDTLDMPDFVQVMGNDKIGYHGISLDASVYGIVEAIRDRYADLLIAVDIGVTTDTAPRLVAAGATKLVSGSTILNAENPAAIIAQFQNL